MKNIIFLLFTFGIISNIFSQTIDWGDLWTNPKKLEEIKKWADEAAKMLKEPTDVKKEPTLEQTLDWLVTKLNVNNILYSDNESIIHKEVYSYKLKPEPCIIVYRAHKRVYLDNYEKNIWWQQCYAIIKLKDIKPVSISILKSNTNQIYITMFVEPKGICFYNIDPDAVKSYMCQWKHDASLLDYFYQIIGNIEDERIKYAGYTEQVDFCLNKTDDMQNIAERISKALKHIIKLVSGKDDKEVF